MCRIACSLALRNSKVQSFDHTILFFKASLPYFSFTFLLNTYSSSVEFQELRVRTLFFCSKRSCTSFFFAFILLPEHPTVLRNCCLEQLYYLFEHSEHLFYFHLLNSTSLFYQGGRASCQVPRSARPGSSEWGHFAARLQTSGTSLGNLGVVRECHSPYLHVKTGIGRSAARDTLVGVCCCTAGPLGAGATLSR